MVKASSTAKAKPAVPKVSRNWHVMHEISLLKLMIASEILPVGGPLDGQMGKKYVEVWDPLLSSCMKTCSGMQKSDIHLFLLQCFGSASQLLSPVAPSP